MPYDYTPLPRLVVNEYPLTTVQPFTRRDGYTYALKLDDIIAFLNGLIGKINDNNKALYDEIIRQLNIVIDMVNEKLADQVAENKAEMDALREYVDAAVQSIIDASIELNDEILAGIVSDPETISRKLLDSLYKSINDPEFTDEVSVLIVDKETGETVINRGDPARTTYMSLASLTKMLNALTAIKFLGPGHLNDLVTITAADRQQTDSPRVRVGDVYSVEDLLYLMALPSDDLAPTALARYVAENYIPNPPYRSVWGRFRREMENFMGYELEMDAGVVTSTFGSSRMSMRNVIKTLKRIDEHDILNPIFSATTRTITVYGENARQYVVEHFANLADEMWEYKGRGVAKTGGHVDPPYGHLAIAFQALNDRWYYMAVVGANNSGGDRRAKGSFVEGATAVKALNAGSTYHNSGQPVDNISNWAPDMSTGWLDATHLFDCETNGTSYSGVYVRRDFDKVRIRSVQTKFNVADAVGQLPPKFRPDSRVHVPATLERIAGARTSENITSELTGVTAEPGEFNGVFFIVSRDMATLAFRNVNITGINIALPDRVRSILGNYYGQAAALNGPDGGSWLRHTSPGIIYADRLANSVNGQLVMPLRREDPNARITTDGRLHIFHMSAFQVSEFYTSFDTIFHVPAGVSFPKPHELF